MKLKISFFSIHSTNKPIRKGIYSNENQIFVTNGVSLVGRKKSMETAKEIPLGVLPVEKKPSKEVELSDVGWNEDVSPLDISPLYSENEGTPFIAADRKNLIKILQSLESDQVEILTAEFREKGQSRLILRGVPPNKTGEFAVMLGFTPPNEKKVSMPKGRGKTNPKPIGTVKPEIEKPKTSSKSPATKADLSTNEEKGGYEVSFNGVPDEALRKRMKESGFRYSSRKALWWARQHPTSEKCAEFIVSAFKENA